MKFNDLVNYNIMQTKSQSEKGIKRCIFIVGVKLWNNANINVQLFERIVCKAISEGVN